MQEYLFEAMKRKERHFVVKASIPGGQIEADFTKRERETIYVGLKQSISSLRVAIRTV